MLNKQTADFSQIHRAADRLEPRLRRRLRTELARLADTISLDLIEQLLAAGDITAIFALLPPDVGSAVTAALRDTVGDVAAAAARAETVSLGLSFGLVNPRAVRWAEDHAARLVTGIDAETRIGIRQVVVRGQTEGIGVARQARMIRDSVGLTRRQSATLGRLVASIEDDGLAERTGRRLRARMVRQRAQSIARTETMGAANQGTLLAWRTAQDEGLLGPAAGKVWTVAPDERLCPICAPLDGLQVVLAEAFVITERATGFRVTSRTGDGRVDVKGMRPLPRPIVTQVPPAHPQCRCAVTLAP